MSRTRIILLFFALATITSIALALYFLILPAPSVVSIEPANNAAEIAPTSPITITFSAPMARVETQNAISFSPRVAGNFVWRDDQTLVFTPRSQLPISRTVEIAISQGARSWLQRPLQSDFVSQFTTLTRPFVMSSTPAPDAQFVYVPNELTITFNRAMDGNVLADSLLIEPMPQQLRRDVDDNVMTIRGFFEPHTQYRVTIGGFATDKEYGIALDRDYVWTFTIAAQYPNFSILNRGRVLKFSPNQSVEIPTQFTNVSRLDAALFPITQQEFDVNATAPFERWHEFLPGSPALVLWSVSTGARLDKYAQQTVELGALERGTYLLKITSPEGVSDAQLVLVE